MAGRLDLAVREAGVEGEKDRHREAKAEEQN